MATLTVATAAVTGTAYTAAAAAGGGDVFPNDGNTRIVVTNGGGSSINVTVTPQNTVNGLSLSAVVVAVAAGASKVIGPFPPQYFNNLSGQVVLTYSAVTSVTVGVIN